MVDEIGFLKKGTQSVGVKRQYSGTAGRKENCRIGVFPAYASRWGHTLIDRRLYLPQDWADDRERRERVAVPDDVTFATKPALAREMIGAALDTDIPCAWVLADAFYGSDSSLRRMLEERQRDWRVPPLAIVADKGVIGVCGRIYNMFSRLSACCGSFQPSQRYSPVMRMCSQASGETWERRSGSGGVP